MMLKKAHDVVFRLIMSMTVVNSNSERQKFRFTKLVWVQMKSLWYVTTYYETGLSSNEIRISYFVEKP